MAGGNCVENWYRVCAYFQRTSLTPPSIRGYVPLSCAHFFQPPWRNLGLRVCGQNSTRRKFLEHFVVLNLIKPASYYGDTRHVWTSWSMVSLDGERVLERRDTYVSFMAPMAKRSVTRLLRHKLDQSPHSSWHQFHGNLLWGPLIRSRYVLTFRMRNTKHLREET